MQATVGGQPDPVAGGAEMLRQRGDETDTQVRAGNHVRTPFPAVDHLHALRAQEPPHPRAEQQSRHEFHGRK